MTGTSGWRYYVVNPDYGNTGECSSNMYFVDFLIQEKNTFLEKGNSLTKLYRCQ